MMKMTVLAVFAAFAWLAVGCGGDDGKDEPLRPADDVRTETATAEAPKASEKLSLGQSASVGDLTVTVSRADYRTAADLGNRKPSPPLTRWVMVTMRIENKSTNETSAPDLYLYCGGERSSSRYFDDSPGALNLQKALPAKSFAEGTALLGAPESCPGAEIRAQATGAFPASKVPPPATWVLP